MFKQLGKKIMIGGKQLGQKVLAGGKYIGNKIYEHKDKIIPALLVAGGIGAGLALQGPDPFGTQQAGRTQPPPPQYGSKPPRPPSFGASLPSVPTYDPSFSPPSYEDLFPPRKSKDW